MINISSETAQSLRELLCDIKKTFPAAYLDEVNQIISQLDLSECDEALLISIQSYLYNYIYKKSGREKRKEFFNETTKNSENVSQNKHIEIYKIITVIIDMQNYDRNSRNYIRR